MTELNNPPTLVGYKRDPKGRLVPVEMIAAFDLARDEFVQECLIKGLALQRRLAEFKDALLGDIQTFVELSAERYDAKVGGAKGNVTLTNYDGSARVTLAVQDSLAFDEGLQAAKALIDECVRAWTQDSRPEIKALINDAFQVDTAGLISTSRVLGLRRLAIDDETWQRAMKAITESLRVQCSKEYIRIEQRNPRTGKFEAIRMDLAGV